MNMNRLLCPVLLVLAFHFPSEMMAQTPVRVAIKSSASGLKHSGPAFEAFVAKQGWVFTADQTKNAGLPDLDGAPSTLEGGAPFSAAAFDPTTFDPRHYRFERMADPGLPTNYNIGDRGVIQFHSPQRCQELYTRHLANTSKGN